MKIILATVIGMSLTLGTIGVIAHEGGHGQEKIVKPVKWKYKLSQAMKAEVRGEKDVMRDANRKPIQTLEFLGFRDDISVIELIPGGGWYSKLLVPTLSEKGNYYAAIFTRRFKENFADKAGFEKANIIDVDAESKRNEQTGLYSHSEFEFDVEPVDMVLTFRNYHNFDEAGRRNINKAAFKALKSGGIYGVIDHTRRHMVPLGPDMRRRIDPVLAIKEIQDAGFVLDDYSTLHYKPEDGLDKEVGHETVTGKTDRWTLRFRKP